MDRSDYTDVFAWAEKIEEEDNDLYDVDPMDLSWRNEIDADFTSAVSRQLVRYMHPDVAWVDEYTIDIRRRKYIATCNRCGKTFGSTDDSSARSKVQTHILRHDKPPAPTYQLPDECPF
jgi:hypothetical protein